MPKAAYLNRIGVRDFTFAVDADTSDAIFLDERQLVALAMPAAWTTAGVAFEVSADGENWKPLYWAGALLEVDAAGGAVADGGISLDPAAFAGWPYARLVSGTHDTKVEQAAARTVAALTRAV